MRKSGGWATRLRTRWLELVLLIGFIGLVVWLGSAVTPGVRSLLPALAPAPVAPVPSLSPIPVPTLTSTPAVSAGKFDGQSAFQYVQAQMAIGPRPTGSDAGRKTGDYIIAQLQKNGWQVEEQEFVYRGVPGRNIIGRAGTGPVALIGAHYDTRRVADEDPNAALRAEPEPGANDGASGVAVLLELARTLDRSRLRNEVWLTFFDAEDNGRLDGWDFIAGSTEMASRLTVTPEMVVIADMIGDRDLQIYKEQNSTPQLVERIWRIAARLGYEGTFLPTAKWSMQDDHTPFLQKGIPAVDLIDFDYPYWHTTQDTADKVAPESLERVGRVLQVLLEGEGR
jgi:glutaminyl-peptide cyclotransferase